MQRSIIRTRLAAAATGLLLLLGSKVEAADVKSTGGLDKARAYKTEDINHGASGDNTIVAAVASKRIKVYAIVLVSSGTVNVKWKDGAATDLTGDINLQAREGYTILATPPTFILATTAGNALILNLSGAVGVDGWVAYWDDDGS